MAGGDYAKTETFLEEEIGIETMVGTMKGGDQASLVLETGRGSVLQAASAAVCGLLYHKLGIGSIGVVTALASFGVVLAAVAAACTLLLLAFLL